LQSKAEAELGEAERIAKLQS